MSLAPNDLEKGGRIGHNLYPAMSYVPPPPRKLANPSPLGLFSFASTTLLLSFINAQTRKLTDPNMVVGMAFAVGGLAQVLAGMCEFVVGNTFGYTAFCSYGGFWISLGLIFWPSSGILAAYEDDAHALNSALGLYMMVWFIFTFILIIPSARHTAGLLSVISVLAVTFLVLGIGHLTQTTGIIKVGGYLGCITAFLAYYTGAQGLFATEGVPFSLPNPTFKKKTGGFSY
ncbi:uncharacterized protein EHS24_007484 [Apiotrichum porosum]|uniref:Ammonia (Ammonium) transport outward n=1 Tax=Apiotrichum porosum TaxID=105984 RepID=A0A427XUG8_9TREE|nr:uncharacterized protein EHS24_007484 [Apiotrichum porosum]RSH82504.1 hypothetical protein EHS24_007484 [Apiotrichum porosum]